MIKRFLVIINKISFVFLFTIISCINDDGVQPDEKLQHQLVVALTGNSEINSSKVWRAANASLNNENINSLDISNSHNINDDEFIFTLKEEGIELEWRARNSINLDANNSLEALSGTYLSPETLMLSFTNDPNKVTSSDGLKNFTLEEDGSISGQLDEILMVKLEAKNATDYIHAPEELTFAEVFTFNSDAINCCGPDMIGSYQTNSIYIVNREFDMQENGIAPERVIKYDLSTGERNEQLYFKSDFTSKKLHIVNDKLLVFSNQLINEYSLDLSQDPNSSPHGELLTRFGLGTANNLAYLVGGEDFKFPITNPVQNSYPDDTSDRIFSYSFQNQSLELEGTLPAPRSGARCTIIDGKLYIAGGTPEFLGANAYQDMLIYDLSDKSIENVPLPKALNLTFVDRLENLVYMAGTIQDQTVDSPWPEVPFIGVYDTENPSNGVTEISNNLIQNEIDDTIHAMTIYDKKMYIIYGGSDSNGGGQDFIIEANWSVMTANLL